MRSPITTFSALFALLEVSCTLAAPPPPCGDSGPQTNCLTLGTGGKGSAGASSGGAGNSGGSNTGGGDAGPDGSVFVGPPPTGDWVDVTGNVTDVPCNSLSYVSAKPDEDVVLLAVHGKGFYASTSGGTDWKLLGTGSGSVVLDAFTGYVFYDPVDTNTFWVSGIHGNPGVAKTTDDGKTFEALGSFSNNDSITADLGDADRKTLLAGTHEGQRSVGRSKDGGKTWDDIGMSLPDDTKWSLYTWVIDPSTYLVGCAGSSMPNETNTGIFRSTDSGTTFTQVSEEGGGQQPLLHSDASFYWPSENGNGIVQSTDKGETWTRVVGPGVVYSIQPIELPDGRIATRGPKGVLVSGDQGKTWRVVAPPEPLMGSTEYFGLTYSKFQKAFFVAQTLCNSTAASSVVRFDWDYEQ